MTVIRGYFQRLDKVPPEAQKAAVTGCEVK